MACFVFVNYMVVCRITTIFVLIKVFMILDIRLKGDEYKLSF